MAPAGKNLGEEGFFHPGGSIKSFEGLYSGGLYGGFLRIISSLKKRCL